MGMTRLRVRRATPGRAGGRELHPRRCRRPARSDRPRGPVPQRDHPGLRRTTGGSPIESLTRLFLLQTPVSVDSAEAALPGLVDPMCNAGLLEQSVSEVAARLDVRPYAASDETGDRDLWVVSDLTPGLDGSPNRVGSDHVLGISSASGSLAQLTVREPVDRALDLGTGCGVQALHLATHASTVVATDVNSRALWMTELNAELNEGAGDRGPGRLALRTRPRRQVRPHHDQPSVRDLTRGRATGWSTATPGLPGDRVVEDIVRDRARPPRGRRLVPGPGQLGDRS